MSAQAAVWTQAIDVDAPVSLCSAAQPGIAQSGIVGLPNVGDVLAPDPRLAAIAPSSPHRSARTSRA
jgi:hypothetical protein